MIALAREPEDTADVDELLMRLAAHSAAIVPLVDVPRLWSLDVAKAAERVAALVDLGQVELWDDHPDGPALILSAEAARRLDVVLIGNDAPLARASWAWVRPNKVKAERAAGTCEVDISDPTRGEGGSRFDQITDPAAADGLSVLVEAETADRIVLTMPVSPTSSARQGAWKRVDKSRFLAPPPRVLLGLRIAWSARDWPPKDEPCPGCGGRELSTISFCLVCSRSGVDDRLEKPTAAELPKAFNPDTPGGLRGGRGKKIKPGRKTKGRARKTG